METVLIVGGGTGLLLEDLANNIEVTYLDSSAVMLEKARERTYSCQVDFVHASILDHTASKKYDVVVFNFVLDLFEPREVLSILQNVGNWLTPQGKLVVSDFFPKERLSFWQKLLLKTVIVFFTITTKHRSSTLPNISKLIEQSDFQIVKSETFFSGMVFASVWKKTMY